MGLNVLDNLLAGLGASTKVSDHSADEAEKKFLGEGTYGEKGGLIPAYNAESGYRDEYLANFGQEKERILGQVDENRAGQLPYNEVAAAQLPGLQDAATPGGYARRIDELSGDPNMQRILERENDQRQRAATAQLSAGGLQRSGAAAQAGADATLTNEEFAFKNEQMLFDRAMGLTGLHKDLPIANMMIPDTLARDMSLADNLVKQGETRGNIELLKGQIQKEAGDALLGNLIKILGSETIGGSGVGDQVIGQIGDIFDKLFGNDDWIDAGIGGVIGGIFDKIFGGGSNTGGNTGGSNTGGSNTGGSGGGYQLPPIIPGDNTAGQGGTALPPGEENIPGGLLDPDGTLGGDAGVITAPIEGIDDVTLPPGEQAGPPQPTEAERVAAQKRAAIQKVGEKVRDGTATDAEKKVFGEAIGKILEALQKKREDAAAGKPDDGGTVTVDDGQGGTVEVDPTNPFPTLPGTSTPGDTGIYNPPPDGTYSPGDVAGGVLVPGGGNVGSGDDQDYGDLNFSGGGSPGLPGLQQGGTILPKTGTGGGGFGVDEGFMGGLLGTKAAEGFGGRTATQNYGAMIGSALGNYLFPGAGGFIGGMIGGIADVAIGQGDQKDINLGVAVNGKPGDDVVGDPIVADSGATFYTVARESDDEAAKQYTQTLLGVDSYLTQVARQSGFEVDLSEADFGQGVEGGDGTAHPGNKQYFGHAGEGSKENTAKGVDTNLNGGIVKYIDGFADAIDDQLSTKQKLQIKNILAPSSKLDPQEKLKQFTAVIGKVAGPNQFADMSREDTAGGPRQNIALGKINKGGTQLPGISSPLSGGGGSTAPKGTGTVGGGAAAPPANKFMAALAANKKTALASGKTEKQWKKDVDKWFKDIAKAQKK